MSIRLGYMVPEFPGQTHIFFWREIKALRRRGVEVRLVSTRRPFPLISRHAFTQEALAETHYLYPPHLPDLVSWSIRTGRQFREIQGYVGSIEDRQSFVHRYGLLIAAVDLIAWAHRHRIEHVHGHSCANTAHILALANAIAGLPYSLTLHGDLDIYGGDHALKMKNAKFVAAVGQHLIRQIVEQVGLSSNRAFSTLMGLDTDRLASIAAARQYGGTTLRIATVARLSAAKGHVDALQAIAKARAVGLDIRYTMIGEGPHRDAIAARIEELGLKDHATLAGTLSEEQVFHQLAVADLFVLPSFGSGEAWPVSVMEAMAAGLPVIATRIGATEEMIRHGEDGFLVDQRDIVGLFSLIELLAGEKNLRERIGRNARATAVSRFDVRPTSGRLLDAILR